PLQPRRPLWCGLRIRRNDAATPALYPLSLHDALPISAVGIADELGHPQQRRVVADRFEGPRVLGVAGERLQRIVAEEPALEVDRSEEHTSELQSREKLVCRLLLEKKNNPTSVETISNT